MSNQNNSNLPTPQFFVDYKKGEVNELKNLLNNPTIDRDITKKKDVIKRVIAYMTLGVDVSKLFSEMVKTSATNDIVMKKMVYLYIINYADENDSLALLAINTLLNDMKNDNPKIRGLALRSLCSLKFKGAYDYYCTILYDSLKDSSPYVRKTAVMGLLKVFHFNSSLISEKDVETLYEMIKDTDSLVVHNTLLVLNEILKKEDGGIAINSKMIIYLLNRIRDFNDWGQTTVLDLVSRFTPKDETQLFDILNILEDRLKHSSSSIVLGCIKIFLNFTKDNNKIYNQVLKRLKDPLITLISSGEISGNHELSYVILTHIHIILLKGGREVFGEMYKKFFIKLEEPQYIKTMKLKILVEIANENSYQEILEELEEYVNDVHAGFSKFSIVCAGSIAMRIDKSINSVVGMLKSFLNRKIDYIVSEALCVVKNLLRKYPDIIDQFINFIEPCIQIINTDDVGLSSIIWILGEFGEKIENAPYIIENIIDNFNTIQSPTIIYSILLATTKLFFKSPGEMKAILGKLYDMILKNYHDVDLRDKTYYYYNLLKTDVELAEFIILGERVLINNYYDDFEGDQLDTIYSQFNTLSVIYSKPEEKFIKTNELENEEHIKSKMKAESELKQKTKESNVVVETTKVTQNQNTNLIGDLIESSSGFNNNTSNVNTFNTNVTLDLAESCTIDQNDYQNLWRDLNDGITNEVKHISVTEIDNEEFIGYLESKFVFDIAHGGQENNLKAFLFSFNNSSQTYILTEMNIDFGSASISYQIKAADGNPALEKKFEEYFLDVLSPLI